MSTDDKTIARRPVTPEWRAQVRAEIKRQKLSQRLLAQRVGCSQAMVSTLLKSKKSSASPLVEKISAELNIDLPPLVPLDPRIQKIAIHISELGDGHIDMVETLVESLPKKI